MLNMNGFTIADVSKHNDENDLWIIIRNEIYDVTKFLNEHPGGREPLLDNGGKDATECFDAIGHSSEAKFLMENFKISTQICDQHPGGEEVLLEQAGKDASEAFEDVGHSSEAREMMTKYKVGELAEADRKKIPQKPDGSTPKWAETTPTSSSFQAWIVPITLAIVGTLLYRYFFTK